MRMTYKLLVGFSVAAFFSLATLYAGSDKIFFDDVVRQTEQFIDWEKTIRLTPKQESIKKAALTKIAAPCCSDNNAYTCCCSCNISRTIWGLSNYMIAKYDASVSEVQGKVMEWIRFINPNGYSGKACYARGCSRAFKHDGCGGMRRDSVAY